MDRARSQSGPAGVPAGAFLGRKRSEGLPGRELVTLALACGRRTARTEHRLQVVPARHVGGHDGDTVFGCGHAHHSACRAACRRAEGGTRPGPRSPGSFLERAAGLPSRRPGPHRERGRLRDARRVNAAVIESIDHGHSESARPDGAVSGHARRRTRPLNRMFCARRPTKPDQNNRHS